MGVGGVPGVGTVVANISEARRDIEGLLRQAAGTGFSVRWLDKENKTKEFKAAVERLCKNVDALQGQLLGTITTVEAPALKDAFKALREAGQTFDKIKGVVTTGLFGRIFSKKIYVSANTWSQPPIQKLLKNIGRARPDAYFPKINTAVFASWDLVADEAAASQRMEQLQQYPYGLSRRKVFFFRKDAKNKTFLVDNFEGKFRTREAKVENGQILVYDNKFKKFSPGPLEQPFSDVEKLKKDLDSLFSGQESKRYGQFVCQMVDTVEAAEEQLTKMKKEFEDQEVRFPGVAMILFTKENDRYVNWWVQMDDVGKITKTELELDTEQGKILDKKTKSELDIPEGYIGYDQAVKYIDSKHIEQRKKKFDDFCRGLPGDQVRAETEKAAKYLPKERTEGLCYVTKPSTGWFSWMLWPKPSEYAVDVSVVKDGVVKKYQVIAHHDRYEIVGRIEVATQDELERQLGINRSVQPQDLEKLIAEATELEAKIQRSVAAISETPQFKPEEFENEEAVQAYFDKQNKDLGSIAQPAFVIWKKKGSGAGDVNFTQFFLSTKTQEGGVQHFQLDTHGQPGTIMIPEKAMLPGWSKSFIESQEWGSFLSEVAKDSSMMYPSRLSAIRTDLMNVQKGLREKAGGIVSLEAFKDGLRALHQVGDFLLEVPEDFLKKRKATLYVADSTEGQTLSKNELKVEVIPQLRFTLGTQSFGSLKEAYTHLNLRRCGLEVVKQKEEKQGAIWRTARAHSFLMSDWQPEAVTARMTSLLHQTKCGQTVWVGRDKTAAEEYTPQWPRLFRVLDWGYSRYLRLKDTAYARREQAFWRIPLIRRLAPLAPPGCYLDFYTKGEGGTVEREEISVSFDLSKPATPYKSETLIDGKQWFATLEELAQAKKSWSMSYAKLEERAGSCEALSKGIKHELLEYKISDPARETWTEWTVRRWQKREPLQQQLSRATEWSRQNKEKVVCMFERHPAIPVAGTKASYTYIHLIKIEGGVPKEYTLKTLPDNKIEIEPGIPVPVTAQPRPGKGKRKAVAVQEEQTRTVFDSVSQIRTALGIDKDVVDLSEALKRAQPK